MRQDISERTVFRLASAYPEDSRSLTAIEMGLPCIGAKTLGDITHGGFWRPRAFEDAGGQT